MKEISIENLAYHLKQASARNLPKPIFFLGAGASFSGKIPLASGIEAIIKENYKDNPDILTLSDTDKNYSTLMGCLSPIQRNELLDGLIEVAKINVTHIYLAQLIEKNLVDYVLTTNFDNLMLRALALFDIFPPAYDLTSISDFTTTTIKKKSVVYLHGQHNGTWLLNTDEEMTKVKTIVPRIFDTIKNERPWIFLGYSGNDPIFEHIKNLGRFDNGLYWVGHDDYLPSKKVQNFLNKPNTNTHFIKGYDADAFMLKLNQELGLEQPDILDKPFSSLKNMLSNIVDIDDEDHFRGAKVRLEIARKNVDHSIKYFENMGDTKLNKEQQGIDRLKKDIIDLIISEQYNESKTNSIKVRAKKYNDQGINNLLAELFFYLGNSYTALLEKCNASDRENLLNKAIKYYNESTIYMPNSPQSLYNCGLSLSVLAGIKMQAEAEALYKQAIEKFNQALKLDSAKDDALNNLGANLINLAAFKTEAEAEALYEQGFEKYRLASEINPDNKSVFNNWGVDLSELAKSKVETEAKALYKQSIEKYRLAVEIDPSDDNVLNNWGISLLKLAIMKEGIEAETLYKQAIEKYRLAIEINHKNYSAIYNLGFSLLKLAEIATDEIVDKLYAEAFESFQQAIDIDGENGHVFSEWAVGLSKQADLKDGKEAEALYEQAIEKYIQAHEAGPSNDNTLNNWGLCLVKLATFKTEKEAETLHEQAIEKYSQAYKSNPENDKALSNWGNSLLRLTVFKTEREAETLCEQAIEKYKQAHEVNPENDKMWSNWAKSLAKLATFKTEKEAESLYEQAVEKLSQAHEADPENSKILSNWGNCLTTVATSKTGKEAEKIYDEAIEKFNEAAEINPEMQGSMSSWGLSLLMSAKSKKEKEAKQLYALAAQKLEEAYKHTNYGYNLACSYARLGRMEAALEYLEKSLEKEEVTIEYVLRDDDWEEYGHKSEFKEVIKRQTKKDS